MVWYVLRNKVKKGPFSDEQMGKLVEAGRFRSDDLVWKPGLLEWVSITEVPGLLKPPAIPGEIQESELEKPEASSQGNPPIIIANQTVTSSKPTEFFHPIINTDSNKQTEIIKDVAHEVAEERVETIDETAIEKQLSNFATQSLPRPWVRYWARIFDYLIAGLLTGVIIFVSAFLNLYIYQDISKTPDYVLGIAISFFWIFIESFSLSTWGTTPGKALLNMKVRNLTGKNLNYHQSFKRSLNVWVKGLGLGIPIITLITLIISYKKLLKDGRLSWDIEGESVVLHEEVRFFRVAIFISIILAFYIFIISLANY